MAEIVTPQMDDRYALAIEFSRDRRHASIAAAGPADGWLSVHLVYYGRADDALDAVLELHGLHRAPAQVPAQRIDVLDPDEYGTPVPDRPQHVDEYQQPPTRRRVAATVVDRRGPACTLIRPLGKARLNVIAANSSDLAEAHGLFLDRLRTQQLRIVPDDRLDAAMRHGEQRPAGDASAWSMRASTIDTAPAKAAELAVWGWLTADVPPTPDIF